ncbi:hypothetical protein OVA26_01045 [Microbacterium sp. SL62]|uniref:hypothetical protein n=1 Tax=Microbacterium sp. SL62 TaxID=2995139 RepID=UPI002272AEE3|nr:hypothetical protein [Microbacterium sp. SL62]MCY1715527.1 hypothetical protein [Microbacterium sp. SL62]
MSNALIAGPIDTATPFSGAGLLDSGSQLVAAIESGNWVEGGLAAFGAVADTVAAVMDPLGSLIAAGLGWLIDHFEPIKGWFNDLTGEAGAVAGFAQTWTNVQNQLDASADYLERVITDLDDMAGEAIEAYRRFQADAAAHIRASASWAGAMSTGLQIASTIVQVVHDLVRDILSQLVGSAISWATQAVVTVGIATPWIIAQVSSRVASWTAKISSKLTGLLRSCGKLGDLLRELWALMVKGARLLGSVPRRAPGGGLRSPQNGDLPEAPHRLSGGDDSPHAFAVVPPRSQEAPHVEDDARPRPADGHGDDGGAVKRSDMSEDGPGGSSDETQSLSSKWGYDITDPQQVRQASVHNGDAPTAMLGKWDRDHPELRYTTKAEEGGHAYFSIDAWEDIQKAQGLDNNGMFEAYNVPFLEDQAAAHKDFYFSHEPIRDGTSLAKEIEWLESHGYEYDRNSMTAIYTGY